MNLEGLIKNWSLLFKKRNECIEKHFFGYIINLLEWL
jgi:hypothetical protein